MTRSRWWTLIAALTLLPIVAAAPAAGPDCCKNTTHTGKKLIRKTYPIAGLVGPCSGDEAKSDARLIAKLIVQSVKPASWRDKGGRGTIEYLAGKNSFVVQQTAEAHRQIRTVLKALTIFCDEAPASTVESAHCSAYHPASATASPSAQPKQYGHFVLDNVRLNAMGVSCTIKHVRLLYKGDGIVGVANSAVANEDFAKKQELVKMLGELLEKVSDGVGVKASVCTPACATYSGPTNCPTAPAACPQPMGCSTNEYGCPVDPCYHPSSLSAPAASSSMGGATTPGT